MNINYRKILTSISKVFAVVMFIAFTIEGVSMSLFSKEKEEVVLFSEMEGHITFNGNPVTIAKIQRYIMWKDDVGEKDFFESYEKGYFRITEFNDKAVLSGFSQFVVTQELTIVYKNVNYIIWSMGKLNKEKYGELGGVPINLRCDLKDEPIRVEVGSGLLGTSCKWDAIRK